LGCKYFKSCWRDCPSSNRGYPNTYLKEYVLGYWILKLSVIFSNDETDTWFYENLIDTK